MSKCSMSNFNVDASPTILPKAEKSTVRADMNKAIKSVKARPAPTAKPEPTKSAKRFDKAMQHPALKNLGL